jgi:hypothetical protein
MEIPMTKLIATYRAAPSFKNAKKLQAYTYAHPFATCIMDDADRETLHAAIAHAKQG